MSNSLDERIQRIHAALGSMESNDIPTIKPQIINSSVGFYTMDGGACYFQFKFDPNTVEFFQLQVNGES